jgi:hypothetical protein
VNTEQEKTMNVEKGWKYYLGITLFVYSFIPYCISGLLLFFGIPLGEMMAFIGVFIVSAEVSFALSVVLLGKTVVMALRAKFKEIFKRKKTATIAKPISKRRHYTGVTLLLLSFLPDIITVITLFFGYPKTATGDLVLLLIMLTGITLFITGLFVLGDEFWERLKKLFQWQGEHSFA